MTLTEAQIQDMKLTIERYKKRLQTNVRDIKALSNITSQVAKDSSCKHIFLAKLAAAKTTVEEFLDTWEKIDVLFFKIGNTDTFPSNEDTKLRDDILDIFHNAQAQKIRLDEESSLQMSQTDVTRASHEPTVFVNKPQLPRITLPIFSGEMTSWVHWRDTFTSLVHSETSLTNIEKFHHLLSCLTGEALSVVSQYKVTDKNYPLAWEALCKTYNNIRVLAYSYIEKILSFRITNNRSSLSDLQNFLTCIGDNIAAFKALNIQNADDVILTCLALRSLDAQTRHQFELNQLGKEFPTTNELINFIRNGCQALKMTSFSPPFERPNTFKHFNQKPSGTFPSRSSRKYDRTLLSHETNDCATSTSHHNCQESQAYTNRPNNNNKAFKHNRNFHQCHGDSSHSKDIKCPHCNQNHYLLRCFKFSQLKPSERLQAVSKFNCCHNCLRDSHTSTDCPSKLNCRFCSQRHHSLLHQEHPSQPVNHACTTDQDEPIQEANSAANSPNAVFFANYTSESEQVLLGTVEVLLQDSKRRFHTVRGLLDSGSTLSFITQSCARRLGLTIDKAHVGVTGLGKTDVIPITGKVSCTLHSRFNTLNSVAVDVFVIPHITGHLPLQAINHQELELYRTIQLADPNFGTPRPVDILLGADIWNLIIKGTPQKMSPTKSTFTTPTIFGEIVTGKVTSTERLQTNCPHYKNVSFIATTASEIQEQLTRFWELEQTKPYSIMSPDDSFCLKFYEETTTRSPSGKYIVRLPFRGTPNLGNNRFATERRFASLERKFQKDTKLKQAYINFMEEYLDLGHMSKATTHSQYIIPHHGVQKGGKLRVVFDASCPSSTSSLNDQLLTGPNLMGDLPDILIRFRFNAVAVVADIVKMYRQILVHPEDRKYQHILWRRNPSEELTEYELNTVTYGEASSSFLATYTVRRIAKDEGSPYPLAVRAILEDVWVDDICSGAQNTELARQLCLELIDCFARGGFELGKWSTNDPSVLPSHIQASEDFISLQQEDEPKIKVLGLVWNPKGDVYTYTLSPPAEITTKRCILSTIARIFDPIGFLAPVVLSSKIYIQKIWQLRLDWDDPIPPETATSWLSFISQWSLLSNITIPRYVPIDKALYFDIIGFSDASKQGYAAVIYLRINFQTDQVANFLIKARTKVAPLKYTSSARLELCGALLLSSLYSSLFAKPSDSSRSSPLQAARNTYLFTDSKTVLDWLHTPSHQLKVFEANRTTAILEATHLNNWYHTRGEDNPADLATRGISIKDFVNNELWWSGPHWLTLDPTCWPITQPVIKDGVKPSLYVKSSENSEEPAWMLRFSNVWLLFRVIARIMRLLPAHKTKKFPSFITTEEINQAKKTCIRIVQQATYPKGIHTPQLISLSPFLDQLGLIRVGGRLEHAPVSYSQSHPVILPPNSHLTKIIIIDVHKRYFHASPSLTMSILRTQYWIPSIARRVKNILKACVPCRRRNPRISNPIMAHLPEARFAQGRPFVNVGIDYAGPFIIRDTLRRKPIMHKAYLCLFICFSTRALHLEAVTSLTTEAFLATLDRFIARRGSPTAFYTDNGTTFVGASNYLKDLFSFLVKNEDKISNHISVSNIKWHFIPPHAPHFGGLWEAGVKSVKRLLTHAIGEQALTYEELSTIFAKVESLLNSRPLVSLNESEDVYDVLTPGHFLIGRSLKSLPEEDITNEKLSHLSRWQLVQSHVRHIWNRWNKEYLHTLQQRNKWTKSTENVRKNQLVVLLEKKTRPGMWPLARIIATHPGTDGVVRVVTIRTPSGTQLRRAVTSLAPIPIPS